VGAGTSGKSGEMNGKNLLRIALSHVMLLALTNCGVAIAADQSRPLNLVFIMTDDQGLWSIWAYGNDEAVTPSIDRLAAQGAKFTNAFASSPVCTPSRVSFLTGLYPTQAGFPYIEGRTPNGLWSGGLPTGVPTWPKELKKHGYVTGLIGKWHLGRTSENNPLHYGIDYFYGFHRGGSWPIDPWLFRNKEVEGKQVRGSLPDLLTNDAMRFIDRNKERPFALMLHFRAPHGPYGPVPEEDTAPYENLDPTLSDIQKSFEMKDDFLVGGAEPWAQAREIHEDYVKERLLAYYASVHSIDRNLGRLMDYLEELELDERTIVIFTSDQGYMVGHRGLQGKGDARPVRQSGLHSFIVRANLFDTSMRIPFIVRWPGVTAPGVVVEELISSVDVPESILRMLGVPIPDDWPTNGRDMTPLLRGDQSGRSRRDAVFGALDLTSTFSINPQFLRSIRTDRWKLVKAYVSRDRSGLLYDLDNDPNETTNLYYPRLDTDAISDRTTDWASVDRTNAYEEIRDDLERRLLEWQQSIDDPILAADRAYRDGIDAARAKWSAHRQE